MSAMFVVGLTGGIASGKSAASGCLRALGARVIDADEIARRLTEEGGEAVPSLMEAFGMSYFDEKGRLNRRKLGALVFEDPSARERLEGILHPMVKDELWRETENAQKEGLPHVILDVPLLLESGADKMCAQVWVVTAPLETRIERIQRRDGLGREEALLRIRSQMPDEDREARAQVLLRNDGTMEEFMERVREAYSRLLFSLPPINPRSIS